MKSRSLVAVGQGIENSLSRRTTLAVSLVLLLAPSFGTGCSNDGGSGDVNNDAVVKDGGPSGTGGAQGIDAGGNASGQGGMSGQGGGMGGLGAVDDLSPRERAALANEPPRSRWLADSPSAMGHYAPFRQASTFRAGPQTNDLDVQIRDFVQTAGTEIGTSPWHVFSAERYPKRGVRTVWGSALRHAYKYVIDGDSFTFAGLFTVNERLTSLPWNLVALADGRVIVPDSDGFDLVPADHPCYTGKDMTFLQLRDNDADPQSPIQCIGALALKANNVRQLCGTGPLAKIEGRSGTAADVTYTGEIVTHLTIEDGGQEASYLLVMSYDMKQALTCARLDESRVTNAAAAEPVDDDTTAMYYATEDAIVKMVYRSSSKMLTRAWERKLNLRRRTGTTPTILNAPNGDKLLVLVDGTCAVTNVPNGLIVCEDGAAPSRLIGVRREDDTKGAPAVISTELPAYIRTIENSPSVRRDMVVLANYSGYLPNGLLVPPGGQKPEGDDTSWGTSPDAVPDFATGVAALRYAPAKNGFDLMWADARTQISSVTAISEGSNMVYGTGAEEESKKTYFYGFLLEADDRGPAGTRVIRKELANAPFRTPRRNLQGHNVFLPNDFKIQSGELYDQGNNMVINSDRSILFPGGSALVRIRDR